MGGENPKNKNACEADILRAHFFAIRLLFCGFFIKLYRIISAAHTAE